MFSFFKKEKKPVIKNRIWLNKTGMHKGMMQEVLVLLTQRKQTVILTFFLDVQEELISFLRQYDIPFTWAKSGDPWPSSGLVLVHVFSFDTHALAQQLKRSPEALIWVRGRCPDQAKEQECMNMLFQLGHSTIFCYVAMDDPFFEVFGGERMKELMLKMGMKEEERMEHRMIDRSIERGMQQLSSGKNVIEITETEAEWYARRQAR